MGTRESGMTSFKELSLKRGVEEASCVARDEPIAGTRRQNERLDRYVPDGANSVHVVTCIAVLAARRAARDTATHHPRPGDVQ